jgi:hypothetical protein
LTSLICVVRPSEAAAIAAALVSVASALACRRRTIRESMGTAVARSSICLVISSSYWEASPVRFPPGCARLATRPSLTGSVKATALTIGILWVACWTARSAPVPAAMMTST